VIIEGEVLTQQRRTLLVCCSSWHELRKMRRRSVFVLGLVIEAGVGEEQQ